MSIVYGMIGSLSRYYIVAVIVIGCGYAFYVQCPQEPNCRCTDDFEKSHMICPEEEDFKMLAMNIEPETNMEVQCFNNPWSDYNLTELLPSDEVEMVNFRECTLPTNSSLGEISNKLGARKVMKLTFQSYVNLSDTLNKKHLQDLPKLKHLILSFNGLTNLNSDLFTDVPNLYSLDLRNNSLHQLPDGIFDGLKKLRLLNLGANEITEIKPGTFDKLESLNSLNLDTNELTTLPEDIFAKLKNLEALNLFLNNFSSLPEGLLRHNVKLRTVRLYNNRRNIMILPKRLFARLTELRTVELRGNGLLRVPGRLFHACISLEKISLKMNYLQSLHKNLFSNLTNLLVLELDYNQLTSLPDQIFSNLSSLNELYLSRNHLTSISRNLFSSLKSLKYLDMQKNQLKVIEDLSFSFLKNLRTAVLSNNQLTFNVDWDSDESDSVSVFHNCTSLEELYLANNSISRILNDWIFSNPELRILDLKFNKIPGISITDLQFISNNTKVDVSNNRIEQIYFDSDEEIAKYQPSFRNMMVLVQNNPIVCDCEVYDFLRYLEGKIPFSIQKYVHVVPEGLTCHSPEWLANTSVTNLKSELFKCQVFHPCPKNCTCWNKLKDKVLVVDCSYRNLTIMPLNFPNLKQYQLELNFTGNKLRMLPLSNTTLKKLMLSKSPTEYTFYEKFFTKTEISFRTGNRKLIQQLWQSMCNNSSMKLTLNGNLWRPNWNTTDFLIFVQNNLYSLDLRNNSLHLLSTEIFDGLKMLRLLNLSANEITDIKPGTFDKLESLNSLNLDTNKLTTLPEDIFAKLENLQMLSLYGNNFSSLPEGLLQHNVELRSVRLNNNRRNMTILPKGLFANLTELRMVELRGNGLLRVPADLFRNCVSLKGISLQMNYLESLPKDLFSNLTNLLVLELDYNQLTSLPDQIFSNLSSLNELYLSKNHLTSISRHLFSSLKSLTYLDMQENQLKVIEVSSFSFLKNLRTAEFSNNQLTFNTSSYSDEYGPQSPFHDCTSLEELYLANNSISRIFGDWIFSNPVLRILDLKFNEISGISITDLQFLFNSTQFKDFNNNKTEGIDLGSTEEIAKYQQFSRDVTVLVENNPIVCDCGVYDFLRYLEGKIHLSDQKYVHIVPEGLTCHSPEWLANTSVMNLKSDLFKCQVFDPCPEDCTCWKKLKDKVLVVDCSYRNLTIMPLNFPNFEQYQLELNFTGNKLRMLPLSDTDLKNIEISKLLLSNNNIEDIHVDELSPNITILELHNNNISKLNSNVLHFINNTSSMMLTLSGNPWTCNCDTIDFLNFVQTKFTRILDSSQITCEDKAGIMLTMSATSICTIYSVIIIGVSLTMASTGLIIGLLAALYYSYQREIKVWLYAHHCCLWLVRENELDKDKLYDAFISYSHKDEDFVVNELVSKLESGSKPFKLCLHFRDWIAGEWIPTQIARSVEDSKRTIVVLSPNFLESVWGRMEFRAAHSQALSEGRARVILILYGEIGPIDDLDEELKAYLNMNTYVKWGDPWFWDKLRYALPHPPELTSYARKRLRRRIFEKCQQSIRIKGEKKEPIYSVCVPETPPVSITPSEDALKVFMCEENNKDKIENVENLPLDTNNKFILSPEELIKNNLINEVEYTTL